MPSARNDAPAPMPYQHAAHLLHPLRGLILSPGALMRRLGLPPDAHVLELGPGPGYFSPALAAAVPQGGLTLVDIQPEMLAMARARLEASGLRGVRCVVGDAAALPLDDASCDAAVLVAVLGELPDRPRAFAELRRVLRPGGLLSVTEQLGDPDALSRSGVRELVRAFGFAEERTSGNGRSFTLNARRV